MLDKLVDFLLQFVHAFRFWFVVREYRRGVLLRLGKFHKVLEPGLHWIYPFFIDQVLTDVVAIRTHNLGALAITTTDGKQAGFEAVVTYKIKDIQTAILKVAYVDDAIKDACLGTIGTTLVGYNWDALIQVETLATLTKACRANGWKYGIEILSVQLAGVSTVRSIRILSSRHHATENFDQLIS